MTEVCPKRAKFFAKQSVEVPDVPHVVHQVIHDPDLADLRITDVNGAAHPKFSTKFTAARWADVDLQPDGRWLYPLCNCRWPSDGYELWLAVDLMDPALPVLKIDFEGSSEHQPTIDRFVRRLVRKTTTKEFTNLEKAHKRADSAYDEGRLDEARDILDRALAPYTPARRAEGHTGMVLDWMFMLRGHVHDDQGRQEAAEQDFLSGWLSYPSSRGPLNVMKRHLERGEYDAVLELGAKYELDATSGYEKYFCQRYKGLAAAALDRTPEATEAFRWIFDEMSAMFQPRIRDCRVELQKLSTSTADEILTWVTLQPIDADDEVQARGRQWWSSLEAHDPFWKKMFLTKIGLRDDHEPDDDEIYWMRHCIRRVSLFMKGQVDDVTPLLGLENLEWVAVNGEARGVDKLKERPSFWLKHNGNVYES